MARITFKNKLDSRSAVIAMCSTELTERKLKVPPTVTSTDPATGARREHVVRMFLIRGDWRGIILEDRVEPGEKVTVVLGEANNWRGVMIPHDFDDEYRLRQYRDQHKDIESLAEDETERSRQGFAGRPFKDEIRTVSTAFEALAVMNIEISSVIDLPIAASTSSGAVPFDVPRAAGLWRDLDIVTREDLARNRQPLIERPTLMSEIEFRCELMQQLWKGVARRAQARCIVNDSPAGRARIREECSGSSIGPRLIAYVSALLLETIDLWYPRWEKEQEVWEELAGAFGLWASGAMQLQAHYFGREGQVRKMKRIGLTEGAPDGPAIVLLPEFAILATESHIDRKKWKALLPILTGMLELYRKAFVGSESRSPDEIVKRHLEYDQDILAADEYETKRWLDSGDPASNLKRHLTDILGGHQLRLLQRRGS